MKFRSGEGGEAMGDDGDDGGLTDPADDGQGSLL